MQNGGVQAKAFFRFGGWFSHQAANAHCWAVASSKSNNKVCKLKKNHSLFILLLIGFFVSACKSVSEISQVPPTAMPMPGWKIFSSKTVEIWLPETYQGGEPGEYLPILIEKLKNGDDLQKLSAKNFEFLLVKKPELLQFSGFSLGEQNSIISTVFFIKVPITNGETLDEAVDEANKLVESVAKVKSKANVLLGNHNAIQVVLESNFDTGNNSIIFYLQEGNNIWILNYSISQITELKIDEVEQSAKTFKILSIPQ
jgi:hypothetical protein